MRLNKPVIIYGAGYRGRKDFIEITNQNIPVEAFVDRNAKEIIRYCGRSVLTPDEAMESYRGGGSMDYFY